jgi:hypothetical protein
MVRRHPHPSPMERIPASEYPALVAATVQSVLRHDALAGQFKRLQKDLSDPDAMWSELYALALAAALAALESLPVQIAEPAHAFQTAVRVFTDAGVPPNTREEIRLALSSAMLARLGLYHMAIKSQEPSLAIARLYREAAGADHFSSLSFAGLAVPLVKTFKDAFSQVVIVQRIDFE